MYFLSEYRPLHHPQEDNDGFTPMAPTVHVGNIVTDWKDVASILLFPEQKVTKNILIHHVTFITRYISLFWEEG